jgi:hypothetical protein
MNPFLFWSVSVVAVVCSVASWCTFDENRHLVRTINRLYSDIDDLKRRSRGDDGREAELRAELDAVQRVANDRYLAINSLKSQLAKATKAAKARKVKR